MTKTIIKIKKDKERDKAVKKKCAELISEFIEKYGCRRKTLCEHCCCTYPTLDKMLRGSENVRIDTYIAALWFIGVKYSDVLKCD